MKWIVSSLIIVGLLIFSCESVDKNQEESYLKEGVWKGVLNLQQKELPFNFNVTHNGNHVSIELLNASERIPLEEVIIKGDSIHIPMYIFDATIHAKIIDNTVLQGVWVKPYADNYIVPFEAVYGLSERFKIESNSEPDLFDGKWEVDFIKEDGIGKAIGLFDQDGSKITGTFLTPTGDYRFLEGIVDGNKLNLSCFDGTHAYLFEAEMLGNRTISGEFWSGKTWYQKWTAKRNEEFELPDPYSMTFMKEGYDSFEFNFRNTDGNYVDLKNDRYKDKVVVVQILGSWCPNCMDETRFYVDWYQKNRQRGVEIIGLAFERKDDFEYASSRVNNMKEKLGVNYEILIAGSTSKESRESALPMLNKIMSFPTSIILDKQHKVRKIHTGFSGPGTGSYYVQFVEEFNLFMDKVLSE